MLFAIPSASFGWINATLHQTFLLLGQLWQLFEVSQILEILQYMQLFTKLTLIIYHGYDEVVVFQEIGTCIIFESTTEHI